jgi:hypothetical protein
MKITPQESRILERILQMLGSDAPANEDLQDYIIGYGVLGRLIAQAQYEYEQAEMERKVAFAQAFKDAKDQKMSDALARETAYSGTFDKVKFENQQRKRLMELRATRETVQETIWAIKYLGKQDGAIGYGT